MAEILRLGLKRALTDAMPVLVRDAKNTANSPESRMAATQLIRDVHEAHMYMLPIGGPLARARARDAELDKERQERHRYSR